jgi:hypothetical protein
LLNDAELGQETQNMGSRERGEHHDESRRKEFANEFGNRSDAEKLEWYLFIIFLSFEMGCRAGGEPVRVAAHIEWVLQRPFQNVAEWIGEQGDSWRKQMQMKVMPDRFKAEWAAFFAKRRHWTLTDATKELERLQQEFHRAEAEGRIA